MNDYKGINTKISIPALNLNNFLSEVLVPRIFELEFWWGFGFKYFQRFLNVLFSVRFQSLPVPCKYRIRLQFRNPHPIKYTYNVTIVEQKKIVCKTLQSNMSDRRFKDQWNVYVSAVKKMLVREYHVIWAVTV